MKEYRCRKVSGGWVGGGSGENDSRVKSPNGAWQFQLFIEYYMFQSKSILQNRYKVFVLTLKWKPNTKFIM